MGQIIIDLDERYARIPMLARKMLDVPVSMFGRDPNAGVDCLGVIAIAATQAGFDCPKMLVRTPGADGSLPPMMGEIKKEMKAIAVKDIRPGDMLWLRFEQWGPRGTDHLATVTSMNPVTIIHTNPFAWGRSDYKVIEHPLTDTMIDHGVFKVLGGWDRFVRGAFRFEYVWLEDGIDMKTVVLKSTRYGRETLTQGARR
jgi:hypothetical protein